MCCERFCCHVVFVVFLHSSQYHIGKAMAIATNVLHHESHGRLMI